jgi:uncharacterized paraquat-inducible protein A
MPKKPIDPTKGRGHLNVKCSNCGEDIANKRVSGRKDAQCYPCKQKKARARYEARQINRPPSSSLTPPTLASSPS